MSEFLPSKMQEHSWKSFLFLSEPCYKITWILFCMQKEIKKNQNKQKKLEGCKVTPRLASRFFCYVSLQLCSESIAFRAGRNS